MGRFARSATAGPGVAARLPALSGGTAVDGGSATSPRFCTFGSPNSGEFGCTECCVWAIVLVKTRSAVLQSVVDGGSDLPAAHNILVEVAASAGIAPPGDEGQHPAATGSFVPESMLLVCRSLGRLPIGHPGWLLGVDPPSPECPASEATLQAEAGPATGSELGGAPGAGTGESSFTP